MPLRVPISPRLIQQLGRISMSSLSPTASTSQLPPPSDPLRAKPGSSVASALASPSYHPGSSRDEDWGTRVLKDEDAVFTMNAWDHAEPPRDLKEQVEKVKKVQREKPVSDQMKEIYNANPATFWDRFYDTHREGFFKDRKWLKLEFPEILELCKEDAGERCIIEIGCGAGNALYPIIGENLNPNLTVHGFDYSKSAIDVVKANPLYNTPRTGRLNAAVWDLSSSSIPEDVQPGTVDIAVMVFVLSALKPGEEWERAVANVFKMLKPGGVVLLRDYGRYDLAQMRIKGGRMLDEDFYIRGDGTRVFFFETDDLARIFTGKPAGFAAELTTGPDEEVAQVVETPSGVETPPVKEDEEVVAHAVAQMSLDKQEQVVGEDEEPTPVSEASSSPSPKPESPYFPKEPSPWHPPHPLFSLTQLGIDRRLLVNRKKQLKMYRVWMQVKVTKIDEGQRGDAANTAPPPKLVVGRFGDVLRREDTSTI